jgi:hypothetical protein
MRKRTNSRIVSNAAARSQKGREGGEGKEDPPIGMILPRQNVVTFAPSVVSAKTRYQTVVARVTKGSLL